MNLKIFSVYDSKVAAYAQPFFMSTTAAAVRAFIGVVKDTNSAIYQHPEDYTLFELGEFDPVSGTVTSCPAPISLGVAVHFLAATNV